MAAALTLVPASLPAQVVTPCGDGPRADSIPEPWDQNTATYAEGNIRLTVIDTVEPAAAGALGHRGSPLRGGAAGARRRCVKPGRRGRGPRPGWWFGLTCTR